MTTAAYIPHSSNEPMAMPPAPLFKGAAEKRQPEVDTILLWF